MNKKTLRIAGWALGLSMAVAGVGIAVGASAKTAMETKAGEGDIEFTLFSGDLTEGDYIIYYDGSAMNTTVDSNRLQYASVTPTNNKITTSNTAIMWHIAPSGDYWTIYNTAAEQYAASTGAKNKAQMLDDGTDDKSLWTVTGSSTYEFVNKKNAASSVNANLRKNGTYGFACYATSTGGALSLYKAPSDPSLSIDTDSETIYTTGENTDVDVTLSWANFDSDPAITVATSDATVIPLANVETIEDNENDQALATITNNGKAGDARITFTATYSEQVATAYVDVTVINNSITVTKIDVTTLPTKTSYVEDEVLDLTGLVVTATYSNSDTSVVTGSCTFTPSNGTALTTSDDEVAISYTYNGGTPVETSFDITVSAYAPYTYSKVTEAPADWRGTYMIVYETGGVVFDGSLATLDATGNSKSVSISDSAFTGSKSLDASYFTIGRSDDGYYLKSASGYYVGRTANSNGMNSSKSEEYVVTPAISDGVFSLTSSAGPTLRFNKSTGQERFRFFGSGQEAVAIYKRNVSVITEANAFGAAFLSATSVCDPTGVSDNITSSIWNAQKTEFLKLSVDAQGLIASTTALSDESYAGGADYEKAATRYNYIVKKYGVETHADFMNRIDSGKLTASAKEVVFGFSSDTDSKTPLAITIILATGFLASTGFVLFRRKREN